MRRCAEVMVKLTEFCGSFVILKCQLSKGDLEILICITNEEDLANIYNINEKRKLDNYPKRIIINEKEQWKIPFLFCPIKINSINKVSVKAKTISKTRQLHKRNNNEMMLLHRKTNSKITIITC